MNDILSMRTKRTFISLEVHQIFMDHEDHVRPTHTHTHTHTPYAWKGGRTRRSCITTVSNNGRW